MDREGQRHWASGVTRTGLFHVDAKASIASLRKKLAEIDKDIKDCHLRHATGKITDETFSIAIQSLEERKGEILLGIEDCENNLSNSENPIDQLMLTCSHIADLWKDSDLETQRKVQFLIFPEGILWDKHMKQYRTLKCNDFFKIINRVSITYRNKKRGRFFVLFKLVRAKGLEPPRLSAPDPKSGLSTNFNTPATVFNCFPFGKDCKGTIIYLICKLFVPDYIITPV